MKKWIVIAAVAMLVLACFGLWATLASVPSSEEHAVLPTRTARPTYTPSPIATAEAPSAPTAEDKATEPVATMEPTATTEPTDTPMPTSTNTPRPTYTPRPTRTPRPTATPVPADTGAEAYLDNAALCLEMMSDGMSDIGTLFATPMLTDDDWIVGVAMAVTMINVGYESLEELDVPAEMQETHNLILWSTRDCYDAMPYLVSGLDNLDADDLDMAISLMTSCAEKMGAATDLLP